MQPRFHTAVPGGHQSCCQAACPLIEISDHNRWRIQLARSENIGADHPPALVSSLEERRPQVNIEHVQQLPSALDIYPQAPTSLAPMSCQIVSLRFHHGHTAQDCISVR